MSQENTPPNANTGGDVYSPVLGTDEFDARDVGGPRAWLLFLGFVAALVILALIVLFIYGGGTRGPDEPPRIIAENTPYKSAPEDPGGAQTPNQDISVYDSGAEVNETITLTDDSEEPIDVAPNAVTAEPEPPQMNVAIRGSEPEPQTSQPATTPAPTAPRPAQQQPAATPAPATSQSAYYVQIAALRSDAEARASWDSFKSKNSDILPAGSGLNIDRVDRGARGVFYRVRVAGFASKDSAQSFCDRLKARSQDCLVVRE